MLFFCLYDFTEKQKKLLHAMSMQQSPVKSFAGAIFCPRACGFHSTPIRRSTSSSRVAQLVAMRMTVRSSRFSQNPIETCAAR